MKRLLDVIGAAPHEMLHGNTLEEMSHVLLHTHVFLEHDSGLDDRLRRLGAALDQKFSAAPLAPLFEG